MHFFGVFCQVHFEARKHGMRGIPADELPRAADVLRRDWPTSIPLLALLLVLFSGYTPYLAAFWGIVCCVVVGLTGRDGRMAAGYLALIVFADAADLLSEGWATTAIVVAGAAVSAVFLARDPGRRARIAEMLDAFQLGAKYAIGVGAAAATVVMATTAATAVIRARTPRMLQFLV